MKQVKQQKRLEIIRFITSVFLNKKVELSRHSDWNYPGLIRDFDNYMLSCYLDYILKKYPENNLVSNEISSKLDEKRKILQFNQDLIKGRAVEVFRQFEREKIEYRVYKGYVLEQILYDNNSVRPYNDIDILIMPASVKRVISILNKLEFKRLDLRTRKIIQPFREFTSHENRYRELNFLDVKTSLGVIDIHWDLNPDFFDRVDWTEIFFKKIRTLENNSESGLRLPGNYDHFLFMLVNIFKHRFYHLAYFIDLIMMIDKFELSISKIKSKAEEAGLKNVFQFILFCWVRIFGLMEYKGCLNPGNFKTQIFEQAVNDILTVNYYPRNPLFYLCCLQDYSEKFRFLQKRLFPDYYELRKYFGRSGKVNRYQYYWEKLWMIKDQF